MARRISSDESPIVIDEFTSVVDRVTGGSYAIQKAIRTSGNSWRVSCHDDIIDWLQPDWTFRFIAANSDERLRPQQSSSSFIKSDVRRVDVSSSLFERSLKIRALFRDSSMIAGLRPSISNAS